VIIKGGSRAGPAQLAWHLQRRDTNERVEILELNALSGTLEGAFYDWQVMSEGTQGRKGLYHANIDPAESYTLTPEQRKRAVDLLEEELGFQGLPRAVVLHEKHGREHLHVVWCRTDYEKGILRRDNQNYLAHERASKKLELEFGHEMVPGKHAKRDRKKQPEFPRADVSHAEWQQAGRLGMTKEERAAQITGLRQSCDGAPAFQAALEEAGYVLARGERRNFVLVDGEGETFSLSRHVTDIKGKAFREFMAGIDLEALPSVEEARDLQRERAERLSAEASAKAEAEKPVEEVSRFLGAEQETPAAPAPSAHEPQPEPSRFAPEIPASPPPAPAEPSKFLGGQPPAQPQQPAPPAGDASHAALPDEAAHATLPDAVALASLKKAREDRRPQPVDPERKQQIIALRAWADGAQAFKKALEEAGYALARGDTGYVLFSEEGVFSLARHAGLSKAKLDAFMSPIPLDSLPGVDELIEARKQPRQPSKFLTAGPEEPPPLPATGTDDLATRMELSALNMAAEAIAGVQREREKSELDALQKALAKRQEEEAARLRENHEAELRAKEVELDRKIARDMESFARIQDEQTEAFLKARQEERSWIKGIIRAIENRWNPALAAERAKERDQELRNFYRRRARERADYEALIQQSKQLEIEDLKERQAADREEKQREHQEQQERYIREHAEARRILAGLEEQRKKEELEHLDTLRNGPPPPKLGK
jgi:hypothetical protein